VGLKLGSAKLTRDLAVADPPTPAEIEMMRAEARRVVAEGAPDVRPAELVAVGGTASNLAYVLGNAVLDGVLTREDIANVADMIGAMPSAAAVIRYQLRPIRARILPAGAVILDAVLERYGIDRVRVSDDGVREGLALATVVAGRAWRDRLPILAAGWRDHPAD
jgi:exopolyphosphatase/pppGpp-phosphohydrolase